jgi:hypothetical protein
VINDEVESIVIGKACLWQGVAPRLSRSEETASWFEVNNLPKGCEAEAHLILRSAGQWVFLFHGKGVNYLSRVIYPSKEDALGGLKAWLRAHAA